MPVVLMTFYCKDRHGIVKTGTVGQLQQVMYLRRDLVFLAVSRDDDLERLFHGLVAHESDIEVAPALKHGPCCLQVIFGQRELIIDVFLHLGTFLSV